MTQDFNLSTCDYLVITGSKLYGYSTPDSDTDLRGFIINEPIDALSLHPFTTWSSPTEDTQVYSLHKFLKDLQRGNMQLLELLYTPQKQLSTPAGDYIVAQRNQLVSGKHVASSMGFAQAEWRKVRCVQQIIKYKARDQETILKELQGVFQLDSIQIREVHDIIYHNRSDDPRTEISTREKVDDRRREEYDTYGYCRKNACHCIRLLDEARQLIEERALSFPSQNLSLLRDIREGNLTFAELESEYNTRDAWLSYHKNERLPSQISTDCLNKLIINAYKIKYNI